MNITVKAKISPEWKKAIAKVQTLGGVKGVKIGVVEKATNSQTGESIAQYAFWNEFGTRRSHARPFMRITAEKYSQQWAQTFVKVTDGKIIQDPNVARRALTLIGRLAVADMQEVIKSNVPPPNADATRKRKEGRTIIEANGREVKHDQKKHGDQAYSGTLYDTGEMYQSINFRLYSREEELNA